MSKKTEHALEKSRIFPYLAWSLVIGFIIFVYTLILELDAEITQLQETMSAREHAPLPRTPGTVSSTPPTDI